MLQMLFRRINTLLSTINIINILFGFGLVVSLFFSGMTSMQSTTITIPYRIISTLLVLLVLALNINKFNRLTIYAKILLVFYFFYILKVFYSLNFSHFNQYAEDDSKYYLFSIGLVFLPLLSVLLSSSILDLERVLKFSFFVVLITTLLILFKSDFALLDSSFMRFSGNSVLNPISVGHIGTSLVILSILYLRNDLRQLIIKILAIALGSIIIIKSGSRSPILALLLFLGVYFFIKSKKVFFPILLIIGGLVTIFWEKLNLYFRLLSLASYRRIEDSIMEGDTGNRNYYYEEALKQIKNSPIFGDNFVLKTGLGIGDYPHNIILESMIALGVIGGILIMVIIFKSLKKSISIFKNDSNLMWIGAIFIQFLVLGFSSGSLWNSFELIILMGLLLNLNKENCLT